MLSQDRSREPLDLTDLGLNLDNWQPQDKNSEISNIIPPNLTKIEAAITSSLPELTKESIETTFQDGNVRATPEDLSTKNTTEIIRQSQSIQHDNHGY